MARRIEASNSVKIARVLRNLLRRSVRRPIMIGTDHVSTTRICKIEEKDPGHKGVDKEQTLSISRPRTRG